MPTLGIDPRGGDKRGFYLTLSRPLLYHYFMINDTPLQMYKLVPVAQMVECPLRGTGGHGFDPGLRHTKVVKNGTSCSTLGTQTDSVELGLVNPLSG